MLLRYTFSSGRKTRVHKHSIPTMPFSSSPRRTLSLAPNWHLNTLVLTTRPKTQTYTKGTEMSMKPEFKVGQVYVLRGLPNLYYKITMIGLDGSVELIHCSRTGEPSRGYAPFPNTYNIMLSYLKNYGLSLYSPHDIKVRLIRKEPVCFPSKSE